MVDSTMKETRRIFKRQLLQGFADEYRSRRAQWRPSFQGTLQHLRELVEAYAHCADRRDAKGQMSLFTADTHFSKSALSRKSCSAYLVEEEIDGPAPYWRA